MAEEVRSLAEELQIQYTEDAIKRICDLKNAVSQAIKAAVEAEARRRYAKRGDNPITIDAADIERFTVLLRRGWRELRIPLAPEQRRE